MSELISASEARKKVESGLSQKDQEDWSKTSTEIQKAVSEDKFHCNVYWKLSEANTRKLKNLGYKVEDVYDQPSGNFGCTSISW